MPKEDQKANPVVFHFLIAVGIVTHGQNAFNLLIACNYSTSSYFSPITLRYKCCSPEFSKCRDRERHRRKRDWNQRFPSASAPTGCPRRHIDLHPLAFRTSQWSLSVKHSEGRTPQEPGTVTTL